MKKLLVASSILFVSFTAFAINKQDLIDSINSVTKSLSNQLNEKYISFKKQLSHIENKLSTGDYFILSQLTGINFSGLTSTLETKYDILSKGIIDEKYNLLGQIDEAENKFKAGIYTTGDYENKLNDIQASLSGYKTTYENKIKLFSQQISGQILDFNNDLEKRYQVLKGKIEKYKAYKSKLEKINQKISELDAKYAKLIKIVGIGQNLLKTKGDEIKAYSLNYFSGLIESEYKKYFEKDPNMIYFQSGLNLKKQVLLGFVESKLSETFNNIIKLYYPDINFDDLKKTTETLNKKTIQEILNDYDLNINFLNSFNTTLTESLNKVDEKLNKLQNTEDKTKVLEILKADIVNALKKASEIILQDIENTLKTYESLLKVLEKQEKLLMDKVFEEYNKNFRDDLNKLNYLLELIKSYKQSIKLPENIKALENLEQNVLNKIEEIKNKQILDKIKTLSNQIDMLPFRDKAKLQEVEDQIKELEKLDKFQDKIDELKLKLQLKKNLNKLYEAGAIKYYYQLGDLSDAVENILQKYYDKYKAKGKEAIFKQKIQKALEKLAILEDSLAGDKRSYYIIMIHNGILKFNYKLSSNDQ